MKRLINYRSLVPAVLVAASISACGVTGPDESTWQDASAFSWPVQDGVSMQYSVDDERDEFDDVLNMVVQPGSDAIPDGPRMNKQLRTTRESGRPQPAWMQLQYLPTRDTLYTINNAGFKATYALVAPLEKGRTWIAAYSDQRPDSATVKATVIERYDYWKVEGKGYSNVVAVRYELLGQKAREEFIRFYAQGIGEILTVHNLYPLTNFQSQAAPLEVGRTVLIQTSASQ